MRTELFIDGQWRSGGHGTVLAVENPATEEIFAHAEQASIADAHQAISVARRAFDEGPWPRLPEGERRALMATFADAVTARSDRLVELAVAEAGATVQLARTGQVGVPLVHLRDLVDRVMPTFATAVPQSPTFGLGIGQGVVLREPVGVVSAITAFNYPTLLNLFKVGPALAAGCTVVLRPSPLTPLSALVLGEAALEAGLPPGVLNVVSGDIDVSNLLTTDPRVDMVSFTGSDMVGKQILAQAASTVKKVVLELGGKSVNIVTPDADLDAAAAHAVLNFTRHSGQGCAAFTRILAHNDIHDELVERMLARLESISVGDPSDEGTEMGPLISARQRDRVLSYVELGQTEGAKLAFGGGRTKGQPRGYYVDPALFVKADNAMRVAREEIFGPVGVVIGYRTDDEAVTIANDSPYGLSGSVWAADPAHGYSIASRLRTGMVHINGGGGGPNPHSPFGGYKHSGIGREWGEAGYAEYFETKSVNWPAGAAKP
ncbi:aldehyde dehydrogenase family protein [Mycolicibacterium porcinum]|uniref:Aldehyde dehydrogenase family protein n=1 Tax=Mycolicibacterium porcinum TaxID=39693 RepID=A0AAW5T0P3_9MYCO|nr:aldehyde dehydrogenase family protein [Mycolicibacterium porcinum]MCV7388087.1 aldehyde dehydrogenase family protein [Mycolicibacterium porcinum]ORB43387.1 aldehyde dehydrogenase [Mycolicibacterium porcinum]CDO31228.1 aldehyde dehydrogenase [Mycolicibacterium vulneris]